MLAELMTLGKSVHAHLTSGDVRSEADAAALRARIESFNQRITPLTIAFSDSLGEGSRAIKALLTFANLLTTMILLLIVIVHIRNLLAQRERFENALKAEKERAQITLTSIGDAVIRINADRKIEYVNAAAERLIGADTMPGTPLNTWVRLIERSSGQQAEDHIGALLTNGEVDTISKSDLLLECRDRTVPISFVGTRVNINAGRSGAVLVLHDMTSEQAFIDRLSWQASHDALTGLPNRRDFERRLELLLVSLTQQPGCHGLMFLDLDQFKIVNDTCGHAAGDALLCQVSTLLQKQVLERGLVARLGGDEFGVLLENCSQEEAIKIAERLRESVQKRMFVWDKRPFNVTASIGLVCLTENDRIKAEVLRDADMACYMAKDKGRNRVQLHQSSDSELLQRVGEMAAVQRIHDAIEHDRFQLYAQAIAPLKEDETPGDHIELLLRMTDRAGNIAPPSSFLPAAERFGLMPLIDRWVVNTAFRNLAEAEASGRCRVKTCAINISGASVGDPEFADYLHDRFKTYRLSPSIVCFEITETGVISDLDRADRFIREFQKKGCRFSLDDFGTGMSSFAYLKRLPVDYLKIDGSFVKDMLDDPIDRTMIEMITRVASSLGKKTIAEFAETPDIVVALRAIGVDYAQGFAIERPRPLATHPSVFGTVEERASLVA